MLPLPDSAGVNGDITFITDHHSLLSTRTASIVHNTHITDAQHDTQHVITMTRGRAGRRRKFGGTKASADGVVPGKRHYEEFGEVHPIDEKESRVKRLKVRVVANLSE